MYANLLLDGEKARQALLDEIEALKREQERLQKEMEALPGGTPPPRF